MVFATPEEMKVISIIGQLLTVVCIMVLTWNFSCLLIEGFVFTGQCANPNVTRATWTHGTRLRFIMWTVLYLAVYYTFF